MTTQHPITPTPELVQLWIRKKDGLQHVVELAAQWGADQELEACCEYLIWGAQWEPEDVTELRAARRPKPPSLKERALHELAGVYNRDEIDDSAYDAIRLALEALPE